jgi:hypothetical protein
VLVCGVFIDVFSCIDRDATQPQPIGHGCQAQNFGSKGWEFESLRAYHFVFANKIIVFVMVCRTGGVIQPSNLTSSGCGRMLNQLAAAVAVTNSR